MDPAVAGSAGAEPLRCAPTPSPPMGTMAGLTAGTLVSLSSVSDESEELAAVLCVLILVDWTLCRRSLQRMAYGDEALAAFGRSGRF